MKKKFCLVNVFLMKNGITDIRFEYHFAGSGKKVGKFPCSRCRLANLTNREDITKQNFKDLMQT